MERKNWVMLATLSLVAAISFGLGHSSGSHSDSNVGQRSKPARSSETAPGLTATQREDLPSQLHNNEKSYTATGTTDLAKVRIENLGQVEFDVAFDLVKSAPKEVLAGWTKRLENLPYSIPMRMRSRAPYSTSVEIFSDCHLIVRVILFLVCRKNSGQMHWRELLLLPIPLLGPPPTPTHHVTSRNGS